MKHFSKILCFVLFASYLRGDCPAIASFIGDNKISIPGLEIPSCQLTSVDETCASTCQDTSDHIFGNLQCRQQNVDGQPIDRWIYPLCQCPDGKKFDLTYQNCVPIQCIFYDLSTTEITISFRERFDFCANSHFKTKISICLSNGDLKPEKPVKCTECVSGYKLSDDENSCEQITTCAYDFDIDFNNSLLSQEDEEGNQTEEHGTIPVNNSKYFPCKDNAKPEYHIICLADGSLNHSIPSCVCEDGYKEKTIDSELLCVAKKCTDVPNQTQGTIFTRVVKEYELNMHFIVKCGPNHHQLLPYPRCILSNGGVQWDSNEISCVRDDGAEDDEDGADDEDDEDDEAAEDAAEA